ncbi:MAG: elongation factor 1-beta [Nanoarchaeota archaeon]
MPATVVIKVKLMPESPSEDLNAIKHHAETALKAEGATNISFTEEPIAFGLKAVIMKLDMPESKGTDLVEAKLATIKGVSSVTIQDYRRAFG